MTPHIVYFELFGKKMKTEVLAKDANHAKEFVKSKIIFHKVENKTLDFLKDIFGMK